MMHFLPVLFKCSNYIAANNKTVADKQQLSRVHVLCMYVYNIVLILQHTLYHRLIFAPTIEGRRPPLNDFFMNVLSLFSISTELS